MLSCLKLKISFTEKLNLFCNNLIGNIWDKLYELGNDLVPLNSDKLSYESLQ